MEESRLKPMDPDYDPKLFNRLYKKTESLRRSLCAGVDSKRFGVDYFEVLSWFDVKFVYTFNKYHKELDEGPLLGHLIKAMQMFKFRILRAAYTQKYSQFIIGVDDIFSVGASIPDDSTDLKNERLETALSFLKGYISENAYIILELELFPPPYIQKRIIESGKKNFNKIPDSIILDYLGLANNADSIRTLTRWKLEISKGIKKASSTLS